MAPSTMAGGALLEAIRGAIRGSVNGSFLQRAEPENFPDSRVLLRCPCPLALDETKWHDG